MYAYKLCQIEYNLRDENAGLLSGSGSLWLSPDSLFIKTDKKWYYLPEASIRGMNIINNNMIIDLKDRMSVELKTKSVHILRALYHYLEGGPWRKT